MASLPLENDPYSIDQFMGSLWPTEGGRVDISFRLNVKGSSQFGTALFVSGTITAEADGTAGEVTLGAHAQRGLQYLVCVCVCVCVCLFTTPH